jgi:drug/metabolite transporter (DMT)-like permease
MYIAGFIVLCFVWGTSWVAIKFSLEAFPPLLGATLRFLVAGAALFAYCRVRAIPLRAADKPWGLLLGTGILVYVINYGLIYWAEQFLNAGVTAVIFATFPLFTSILSNFVFRSELFRPATSIGLIMGLLGVFVIFHEDFVNTEFGFRTVWAGLAVLGSSLAAALSSVLVKKHLSNLPPVELTFFQLLFGTGGLLLTGVALGELPRMGFSIHGLVAVLYLGLAASALAFVLYYWLLQQWSAVSVSLLVYFTPVVAILFGWLLLDEALSARSAAGATIILSGILTSQVHKYRHLLR